MRYTHDPGRFRLVSCKAKSTIAVGLARGSGGVSANVNVLTDDMFIISSNLGGAAAI